MLVAVALLYLRLERVEASLAELRDELNWRLAALDRAREIAEKSTQSDESAESRATASAQTSQAATVRSAAVTLRSSDDRALPPSPSEPGPTQTAQAVEAEGTPRFSLPSLDFEEIFGRRLPIWAGGVALAVAGVFLVRYSIERGLITPEIRVALAFVFGLLLLAGAELAYRFENRVADPRVRQALAGAGLATLYAGFYLAGTQYGLIGQGFAFLGLALVTAAAIALSFRFGLPSAVLGLVGGFAAPALVGGEEANVPMLALYLGLVTAGLTVSGRRQARPWMGIAALLGGLGWGALLLLAGDPGAAELLALGLYFVVLGSVLPAFAGADNFERPLRFGAAVVASVQLALLVDQGGYAPLAWGLYLLLAAALARFAWRRPELREASAAAAVIGVLLYAQWPVPEPLPFALVGFGLAALFAGVALFAIARKHHRVVDLTLVALTPPTLALTAYATFGDFEADKFEPLLALAAIALAGLPLGGAWLLRDVAHRNWFAGLLGSGAALAFAALLMVAPGWSAPLAAALVLAGPALLAQRRGDVPLANLLWVGAAVALAALIATPHFTDEADRMIAMAGDSPVWRALLRWLAAALTFAVLASIEKRAPLRRTAEALAALLSYGLAAQIVPGDWLAWAAALLALAIGLTRPERAAASWAIAGIALLWALQPLARWLGPNFESLAGYPSWFSELPGLRETALRILPLLACAALLPVLNIAGRRIGRGWLVAPLALVAVHVVWKQLFAVETLSAFVDRGMAERTLWEALLIALAWVAHRGVPRLGDTHKLAIVLAALALAHFSLYTGLLHNPLWSRQAVGPTPLANWILASHAVAIGAALLLRQWLGERWRPALDGVVMAIAGMGAIALLRQAFAGAIPADAPMGQTEDLLRSLLGIVLALFFLWVGSRRGERSWRVGSLVLMLIAVVKVFVLDTAGLEGLLRVASFMALGFSLIGIGWVYSRQLRRGTEPTP